MTDLEHTQKLISEYGSARQAAIEFNRRMEDAGLDYRIDQTCTLQRIAKGRGKPSLIALVRYVLN